MNVNRDPEDLLDRYGLPLLVGLLVVACSMYLLIMLGG